MAEKTATALKLELDKAMEAVHNCSQELFNAENALSHREKILGTDQEKEYGCLIAENEAHHAQKDACGRVETMLMTISGSEPAKLAYLTKTLNRTLTVERALPAIKQNMDFYNKAHIEIQ